MKKIFVGIIVAMLAMILVFRWKYIVFLFSGSFRVIHEVGVIDTGIDDVGAYGKFFNNNGWYFETDDVEEILAKIEHDYKIEISDELKNEIIENVGKSEMPTLIITTYKSWGLKVRNSDGSRDKWTYLVRDDYADDNDSKIYFYVTEETVFYNGEG